MKTSDVPRHDGAELRFAQFAIKTLGDIQRHDLFRWPVATDSAAILAAVAGIDDHRSEGAAGVLPLRHA